ncbi:MAG: phosphohistidine phosphatase SixA [Gammaproteobacteria bacterium]|jgi:phosphohistidine phosphatase
MKLFLVQHGDAVSKDIDSERPLSESGRRDVERLAAFLKRADLRVSRVLHSGKRRAEQTAAALDAAVGSGGGGEPVSDIAPNDDVKAFAATLDAAAGDLLVVGHLPFMARLVGLLVCGDPDRQPVNYRPGSLVCLAPGEADDWAIDWMLRPELLPPAAS